MKKKHMLVVGRFINGQHFNAKQKHIKQKFTLN